MIVQNFFRKSLKLSNDELVSIFSEAAKREHLKKGHFLIKEGEAQVWLPFLLTGVLRGFQVNESGLDTTDCFICHYGDIVMGCDRLGAPSVITIEALEDTELLEIPAEIFLDALGQYPELWRLYVFYLTEALDRHWEEKMLLRSYCATARYQWFLKTYPGLIDQISNRYIASFLGITPVSLSRIRRQLREDAAAEPRMPAP